MSVARQAARRQAEASIAPAAPPASAGLDANLHCARGLACLLLVLYHVIGSQPTNGLRVAEGELRLLSDALALVRMPLFAFIAGFAHALRPAAPELLPMLRGKALRLLRPTLVVGTLFALAQSWTPGTNQTTRNWALLHIEPVGHYWFTMALFWIFVVVGAMQRGRLLADASASLCFLGLAVLAYLHLQGAHYLALDGALYLLPFFVLGMHVQQGRWLQRMPPLALVGGLSLLALPALLVLPVPSPDMDRRTLPVLWIGLCLSVLMVQVCPRLRFLRWLGGYSYAIFLFHVFFTAAARLVWQAYGFDSLIVGCALGVAAGMLGPAAVQKLIDRLPWSRPYLLGSSGLRPKALTPVRSVG